jgi:hypothetical protein
MLCLDLAKSTHSTYAQIDAVRAYRELIFYNFCLTFSSKLIFVSGKNFKDLTFSEIRPECNLVKIWKFKENNNKFLFPNFGKHSFYIVSTSANHGTTQK